jgi:hypothetical protein
MTINNGAPAAIAEPSNDNPDTGASSRWDKMELNCVRDAVGDQPVCWVNTTNVDFFSLGITIKGRQPGSSSFPTFGLALNAPNPVTGVLKELEKLPKDYTDGRYPATGEFLRFLAPGIKWKTSGATALNDATKKGWDAYRSPNPPLLFSVGANRYKATTVGNDLVFEIPDGDKWKPLNCTNGNQLKIWTPTPWEVAAAPPSDPVHSYFSPFDTSDKADATCNDARKFVAAYLNRGVFRNSALWYTPDFWYEKANLDVYNQYSKVLHDYFIKDEKGLGKCYGFSFDDVPQGVSPDPSIQNCSSMTLTITNE